MGNLDQTRVGEAGEVDLPEDAGIMPRSFAHLFSEVKSLQLKSQGVRYLIRCSFIEIYNEELRDLLAVETRESTLPGAKKKKLEIKEKRFGIEPEITAKLAKIKPIRIYEVGISYYGRTYDEGKKIGWKDGFRAIYCILKYKFTN